MVKLWIHTPSRKGRVAVDVNLADTVSQLKGKLTSSASLQQPASGTDLVLIYQGAIVKDNEVLSSIKPPLKEEDNLVFLYSKPSQADSLKPAPTPPSTAPLPGAPLPDNMQNMIAQITNAFTQSIGAPAPAPQQLPPLTIPPTFPQTRQPAPAPAPTVDPLTQCKDEDVQILLSMGFPELRCRKALVLNNHDVNAASEWLLEHIADPQVDAPLTSSQQRALSQQRRVVSEVVDAAVEANVCTFFFTGRNYIAQEYYRCLTCNMRESEGCCVVCARNCHQNHNLSPATYSTSFYCDCGMKATCTSNPTPGQGGS
eukprot:TRINITY_DN6552_c0_g2_i2.p1 TRINITY_DN6552_c0_g2~~TRINITY_DN6552_c0_g2_i2.p1  ORF type:complete len:313 (+),score=62.47 TRINITY_DN6552_c0_g2_i2:214-1152(+)